MIRDIRRKFMRIALAVLALAMALVALGINAANWIDVRAGLRETLDALCQDAARLRQDDGRGEWEDDRQSRPPREGRGMRSRNLRGRVSEARFFTVDVSDAGEIRLIGTDRETEYTAEELLDVAGRALRSGRANGFVGNHLFADAERPDGGRTVVFLNCETRLNAVRRLAAFSAGAWLAGLLLAWALVAAFSDRAIRPMVENAVMQKQFITDAGHELKTPLTVISANMDVLQLETGENEWIRSTQKQVAGLRGLVNELIYLSRLDEEDARLQFTRVDLKALVEETAEPFAAMAEFSGKSLAVDAQAAVLTRGDPAALGRLIAVLCDNAVKYAPEGDRIDVALRCDNHRAVLTVENALAAPLEPDVLRHLFDRFYRADPSRSKEKGGYGLGLSIARAVAEKHGGAIDARQTDDGRLRFIAALPVGK